MKTKIPIILVVAVFLCGLAIFFSFFQLWTEVSDAVISLDGEVSPTSKVYASKTGNYLIHIDDPKRNASGDFFVYSQLRRIGFGVSGWTLPWVAITSKNHLDQNVLSGTDKFPANLNFEANGFELSMPNETRIAVCYKDCASSRVPR